MRTLTHVIFWTLALALLASAIALHDGREVAPVVAILSPLPAMVVALLSLRSWLAFGKRRITIVLSYLDQAFRLNLPLPRFLTAAAASEDFITGQRLMGLRDQLETGKSLSQSIAAALPEAPSRTVGLLAAAERTGCLPQTLARLVHQGRRRPRNATDQAFLFTYPIAMTVGIVFIVGMIMIFLLPRYEQVMRDFRAPVAWPTALLLEVSRFLALNLPWMVIALLAMLLMWFLTRRLWPAREWRWTWLTGWFTRDRDLADVCRVVADALAAGLPLDIALRQAAELPMGTSLRGRLMRWAGGIERGLPATDAARQAGMPRIVSGLTATAEIAAAHATFEFLARYYRGLFRRSRELARAAVIPAMVFFFAGLVLFIELGLFLPIIAMINLVAPYQHSL